MEARRPYEYEPFDNQNSENIVSFHANYYFTDYNLVIADSANSDSANSDSASYDLANYVLVTSDSANNELVTYNSATSDAAKMENVVYSVTNIPIAVNESIPPYLPAVNEKTTNWSNMILLGDQEITWHCVYKRLRAEQYTYEDGATFIYNNVNKKRYSDKFSVQNGSLFFKNAGETKHLIYKPERYKTWDIDGENLTSNRQITWGLFLARDYFFVSTNIKVANELKQDAIFEKDGRIFINNELVFFRKGKKVFQPLNIVGTTKDMIVWQSLMKRVLGFFSSDKLLDKTQREQVKILNNGQIFLGTKQVVILPGTNRPTDEPARKKPRISY